MRMLAKVAVLASVFGAVLHRSIAADLVVDPARSQLNVAVHATGDKFVAHLQRFDASIQVHASSGKPCGGKIEWDFRDLKTAKLERDKEMLRWLDYEHRPKGMFQFQKCEEKNGEKVLTGDLTMHGVSRLVTIPLTVQHEGSDLDLSGELTLDHRDYDLPRIVKFAILRVDPVLKIRFTLKGKVKE